MPDTVMEPFLERAIAALSPSWAASRSAARRMKVQNDAAVSVYRKYEAASTGRRNEGWMRPGTSANAEIYTSLGAVRNGARQLVGDNGHAANALNVLTNNVIGTGIRPDIEAQTDRTTRRLQELWEQHMESSRSGAEDSGNFYERQALGFRAIVESGAVVNRRRRRTAARSDLVLPFQVQQLEPDFIDLTKNGSYGNNTIIRGKEYDRSGDVVAYWLYTAHPGDNYLTNNLRAFQSIRVTASEIAHAFRRDRPGQVDGISWFAPIMTDLRDLADTRDAYQLRQKIAACFTVFITEPEPGAGTAVGATAKQPLPDHIEPGLAMSLPPGKDVSFAAPPGVEGMADFDRAQLLTVAAGFGMPYEALTGDLRNVNFLSGRMGWLSFYKNIDAWRTRTVIPRLCEPELRWFLESAAVSQGLAEPVQVTWTSPSRDLLDPTKEIKALREEMRLGTLSFGDACRMRGRDPDKVLAAWERWAGEVDQKKLVFDWDPRHVALSGTAHDPDGGDSNAQDSDA